MNTQAENQASAAALPFPATINPVPSIPSETDPRRQKKAAKEYGRFSKEGKPRPRSMRAKRSLREDQKKPNRMRSVTAMLRSSPKKKDRMPSNQGIEPAAPGGTEEVVEPLPLYVRSEPDPLATETIALAKTDMPGLGATAPPAETNGLLTVTLRVRHRPLAVVLKAMDSFLTQAWSWTQQKLKSSAGKKRLRVCESVSLGEKRFVAVIQVDGEQFLVGGSASSVSTLAHLERPRGFSDVFERHCKQDLSPA